jgi:hypothetical protein
MKPMAISFLTIAIIDPSIAMFDQSSVDILVTGVYLGDKPVVSVPFHRIDPDSPKKTDLCREDLSPKAILLVLFRTIYPIETDSLELYVFTHNLNRVPINDPIDKACIGFVLGETGNTGNKTKHHDKGEDPFHKLDITPCHRAEEDSLRCGRHEQK